MPRSYSREKPVVLVGLEVYLGNLPLHEERWAQSLVSRRPADSHTPDPPSGQTAALDDVPWVAQITSRLHDTHPSYSFIIPSYRHVHIVDAARIIIKTVAMSSGTVLPRKVPRFLIYDIKLSEIPSCQLHVDPRSIESGLVTGHHHCQICVLSQACDEKHEGTRLDLHLSKARLGCEHTRVLRHGVFVCLENAAYSFEAVGVGVVRLIIPCDVCDS
jgi:hypothetical protein